MRLASALDEAEAATPSWWAGIVPVIGGHAALRAAAVAVMVIAAFAVVLLGRRAAPVPDLAADPAGVLPMASLTPGAVSSLTAAELCSGIRPSRLVTSTTRRDVLRAYGMEDVSIADYELDALITPELGGSTDPANLWPQRYHSPVWNARVKDELERRLPELVCDQSITLAQAQQEIATDWIAAYKRHFRTDAPLPAHRAAAGDDEEELILVSDRAAAVLTNR